MSEDGGVLETFAEGLGQAQAVSASVRKFVVDIGVIAIVLLGLVILVRGVVSRINSHSRYSVEQTEIADEAKNTGLSSAYIQSEIAFAIRTIEASATGLSQSAAKRAAGLGFSDLSTDVPTVLLENVDAKPVTIVVPEIGVSIDSVENLLRKALNIDDIPIRSRVFCSGIPCDPHKLKISVAIGGAKAVVVDFNADNVERMAEHVGTEVLRLIDPYIFAVREFASGSIYAEQDAMMVARYSEYRRSHALSLLGVIYQSNNELDKAEKYYQRAIQDGHTDPVAAANLARLYRVKAARFRLRADCELAEAAEQQQRAKDLFVYTRASLIVPTVASLGLTIDSLVSSYFRNLAAQWRLEAANRYHDAARLYWRSALSFGERAVVLAPNRAEIHNIYGNILADGGRNGAALSEYDKALSLDAFNSKASANRGEVLRDLGFLEESQDAYMAALRLDARSKVYMSGLRATLREIAGAPRLPSERDFKPDRCRSQARSASVQWSSTIN